MPHLIKFLTGALIVFCLASCSMLQNNPQANQRAMCKELNHRIINNGATGNQLQATQQRAEADRLTRSYHEEGC
jgi:two-component sensor histidine kinase